MVGHSKSLVLSTTLLKLGIAFLVGACGFPTISPTGSSLTTLTTTPIEPFANATTSPSPYPINFAIEPLVVANVLRFDSWSPDSRWIAYWVAEQQDAPAFLAFADIDSSEICVHEEVVAQNVESGWLIWQEDGRANAILDDEDVVLAGYPCEIFTSGDDFQTPDPRTWVEESPNRLYSAETHIFKLEGPIFHTNLRITETQTSKELFSFNYMGGAHTFSFGPSWLNDELYLVGYTLDQGILYYLITDNKIGHVLPDFFDLPISEEENITKIGAQIDPIAGDFHLLFETNQGSLLYHSELDQVEELPFYMGTFFNDGTGKLWSFSPDGKWMLLSIDSTIHEGGIETWYRSVDPPGSTAAHFLVSRNEGQPPVAGQLMVRFGQGGIDLVSFPDGQLLSNWRAANFYLDQLWRSPDGTRFVAFGIHSETGMQSLFIIEP